MQFLFCSVNLFSRTGAPLNAFGGSCLFLDRRVVSVRKRALLRPRNAFDCHVGYPFTSLPPFASPWIRPRKRHKPGAGHRALQAGDECEPCCGTSRVIRPSSLRRSVLVLGVGRTLSELSESGGKSPWSSGWQQKVVVERMCQRSERGKVWSLRGSLVNKGLFC